MPKPPERPHTTEEPLGRLGDRDAPAVRLGALGLLTLAGCLLESQYEKISGGMNPVSTKIFAIIAIVYLVRVVRHPVGRCGAAK